MLSQAAAASATPGNRPFIKDKENFILKAAVGAKGLKTPGLKTSSILQSSAAKQQTALGLGTTKKNVVGIERLKLGEVKNGTPFRGGVDKTKTGVKQQKTFITSGSKTTAPPGTRTSKALKESNIRSVATTKKKNLKVWKDEEDQVLETTKAALPKPAPKEKVKPAVEIEYGPPNTLHLFKYNPPEEEQLDLDKLVFVPHRIERFVSKKDKEAFKRVAEGKNLEFEVIDAPVSQPVSLDFDLDLKFDNLDFSKLF